MPNLDLTNDELAVLQNRLALAGEINPDTLNPEVVESLTQKVDNLAQEVRLNEVLDMDPEQLDAASLGLDVEAANLYGWGSPEHLDAIPEAARENPELPGIVFDVPEPPQHIQDALGRLSNMHSYLDIARDAEDGHFVVVRTWEISEPMRSDEGYNVRDTVEYSAPTLEALYEIIEKNAATRLTTAQIRQLGAAEHQARFDAAREQQQQQRPAISLDDAALLNAWVDAPDRNAEVSLLREIHQRGLTDFVGPELIYEQRLDPVGQVITTPEQARAYVQAALAPAQQLADQLQTQRLEAPILLGTVDNTNIEKIAAEVTADRTISERLYDWVRDKFSSPHLDDEHKRIGHPKLSP